MVLVVSSCERRGGTVVREFHAGHRAPREQACTSLSRSSGQLGCDGTHPAHGYTPLTGAVADQGYRKQRFCTSVGSRSEANVPMSASVATTPRARSSANRASIASPSGLSAS